MTTLLYRLAPIASVVACAMLVPISSHAQQPGEPSSTFERRAREIVSSLNSFDDPPGSESLSAALAHAHRAVDAARSAARAGRADEAQRALMIAEAAVVLAHRLRARASARASLADARTRLDAARVRASAARSALERALRPPAPSTVEAAP